MARALLKYRAKVRGRLQVQKVERDRKRNNMRFMSDRFGCLKHLFSEESLEPAFSKEDAERYLSDTFPRHTFTELEENTPVPASMPKGPGMGIQQPISVDDIKLAMKGKRDKSAPGDDKIRYGMLRELGPIAMGQLAKFFTLILNGKMKIPPDWGIIRVRMLHKGKGADPIIIDSFRPISLDEHPRQDFQLYNQSPYREVLHRTWHHRRRRPERLHAQGKRLRRSHQFHVRSPSHYAKE